MIKELNLPQEFTLLALNEQGNINNNVSAYQEMYFLAAIFIELALLGKVEIQEKLLVVKNQKPTQIFHLDVVVEKFNTVTKAKSIKDWLYELYVSNKISACKNILESLIREEVLNKEEGKFLLVFPYTKFLVSDRQIKDQIIKRVREAILEDQEITLKTSALILLLEKSYILKDFFSKYEKSRLESKLKEIQNIQNPVTSVNQALSEIIDEVSSAADNVVLSVS